MSDSKVSIERLELGVRASNSLKAANIDTVGDLVDRLALNGPQALEYYWGIGRAVNKEILTALSAFLEEMVGEALEHAEVKR